MIVEARQQQASSAPNDVFRPIQYLGSKVRSLEAISRVVDRVSPGGTVVDAFSGTSVVGQALAARGHRILAADAMQFAAVFARALLGVGRITVELNELLTDIPPIGAYDWADPWSPWLERERRALMGGDGRDLISISLELPQVWRSIKDSRTQGQMDSACNSTGKSLFGVAPLTTTHYAGTYLGVQQALEIDAIRHGIEQLRQTGRINPWGEALLLTALLAAMSSASFSAGKHFAQPHAIHRPKDLSFAIRRIVDDRRRDIRADFERAAWAALKAARPADEGHVASWARVDSAPVAAWIREADLLYADPPYTAQQYSRFYHVPEVIVSYIVPRLELADGAITRGLYPEGRFKSPFSSKRLAPAAFRTMIQTAAAARTSLVLSYSASVTGTTGNDRMISLGELQALCKDAYSRRVELVELDHAYRQFNGSTLAIDDRADHEFLIVCRADPR